MSNNIQRIPKADARFEPEAPPKPDFMLLRMGSLVLFAPLTSAATNWLQAHCPPGPEHSYLGPNLAVEVRYIQDLVDNAIRDGLQPRSR